MKIECKRCGVVAEDNGNGKCPACNTTITGPVPIQKCCTSPLHVQIAYTSASKHTVESMQGIGQMGKIGEEDRAFLHVMLDEYLTRRHPRPEGDDHFIVFCRFPSSL